MVKNLPASAGDARDRVFDPWVGKIPWRIKRPPTPVFFPGESPWTGEPGGLQSMGSHLLLLENKDNGCNYCSHL